MSQSIWFALPPGKFIIHQSSRMKGCWISKKSITRLVKGIPIPTSQNHTDERQALGVEAPSLSTGTVIKDK